MNYPTYSKPFGLWKNERQTLLDHKGDSDLAVTARAKYPQLAALLDELSGIVVLNPHKEGQLLRAILTRVEED